MTMSDFKDELKEIARAWTPPVVWNWIKRVLGIRDPQGSLFCPVCGKRVDLFQPISLRLRKMYEQYPPVSRCLSETLYWHAYSCPHCGASDRSRLYAMYLSEKFLEMEKTGQQYLFLDIAPTWALPKFIKSHGFIRYRSADLYMENVDDKVDIMDMNIYQDGQFDVILCSHVLEHVNDDRKALSELYRVLKPSGFAIVMVPINLLLEKDFEDKNIVSEADRWRYFGQNDHVRSYSKNGFITKLKETGFIVHQYDEKYFGAFEFRKFGIEPHSVLYVVTK